MDISTRKPNLADVDTEKKILTAMIVNTLFLKKLKDIFTPTMFKQNYMNNIAAYCIDFYEKFDKAPNRHIEDIFNKQQIAEDRKELINKFLLNLSNEYLRSNLDSAEYLFEEIAKPYFEKFNLLRIVKESEALLVEGRTKEAQDIFNSYKPLNVLELNKINIYDPYINVFSEDEQNKNFLFSLPGELGKFTGNYSRGELNTIVAPSGVGKSWFLQYATEAATINGLNVLFVSMEMSEAQVIKRFRNSLMLRPTEIEGDSYTIPVFDCYHNQLGTCVDYRRVNRVPLYRNGQLPKINEGHPAYKICDICKGNEIYDPAIWYKNIKKKKITDEDYFNFFNKIKPIMNRRGKIHFEEYPMGTLTIDELFSLVESVINSGFEIDLLVTDYGDKMAIDMSNGQYRHQIGAIWAAHKAIAQKFNIGVFTASQSNTSRDPYRNIDRGDFEEAITKLNVTDSAWSINQFPDEKDKCLFRLRNMKKRSEEYTMLHECYVLSALKLGRPCIDSCIKKIPIEELKKNKKKSKENEK